VRACVRDEPDVCLLDAGFDGDATAGIALPTRSESRLPPPGSSSQCSDDPEGDRRGRVTGVAGYALKTCPVETLMSSIERVAAGEPVIETELLRRALLHGSGRTNPVAQLTRT
jgi:DNA-binding NarL/FixJ family response regulator